MKEGGGNAHVIMFFKNKRMNTRSSSLPPLFNSYGEVDGESVTVGGQGLYGYSLTLGLTGCISTRTETVSGTPVNYSYTYDPIGRLRTVTRDGSLVEEYRYDGNGRRNYEMDTLRGIAGTTLSYDDEDHLVSVGSATYQYNVDGFLTIRTEGAEVTSYNYSSRGELLSVSLPDGRLIEYVHDPLGRRIAKKVNGAIVEKYLWQGLTRLLAVYDGNNNLLMRFQYADGRMPVDMTKGGTTYYLGYDQVGSLRMVTDASGNIVKRIDYDSFGSIIVDSAPAFSVPFGFAGGLHDRDTNLVRYGFRDYDPAVGRWTAKDPIGFEGEDTDLYGYSVNNPVNFIDPNGLRDTTILDWPDLIATPFSWHWFHNEMRRMLNNKLNSDFKSCLSACADSSDINNCLNDKNFDEWLNLLKNYDLWKAIKDSYRFDPREAIDHCRKEIDGR